MPRVFKSVEEQRAALATIPEFPPPGTPDIDAWRMEQEALSDEIMQATIDPAGQQATDPASKPAEPSKQEPPVEPAPAPQAQQPQQDQTPIYLGRYTYESLPEHLKQYVVAGKSIEEIDAVMVEQMSHARRYANESESRIRQLAEENAQLRATQAQVAELQKQVEEMKKARDSLQAQAQQIPQTPAQRSKTQSKIDEISSELKKLEQIGDEDFVPAGTMKKAVTGLITELSQTQAQINEFSRTFDSIKAESRREVESLKEEIGRRESESKKARIDQERREANERMLSGLAELQEKHPELKTALPILSDENPQYAKSLEGAVASLCDRISGGADARDPWSLRNRVINAIVTNDPEVKREMLAKGVVIESFGITEADVQNYALLTAVHGAANGLEVDPHTGTWKEIRSRLNNQKVTFPSFDDAYNYILDRQGIRSKMEARRLEDAARKGQQAMAQAAAARDVSGKVLTGKYAGAEAPGNEMAKENALLVLRNPNFLEQSEYDARKGDRRKFNEYNRAMRTLGLPEEKEDPAWPKAKLV